MGPAKFFTFTLLLGAFGMLTSCGNHVSDPSLISVAQKEIAGLEIDGNKPFKTGDNPNYFAILYTLPDSPENLAKLRTLCYKEELGNSFRNKVYQSLEKGDILARLVKEGRGLAVGVSSGDLEYHVYFSPQELSKIFK